MRRSLLQRFSVLPVLISLCLPGLAQRNCERGDKYFDQNLFTEAIKYYQLDLKSKNRKASERAMQKLADCYRIIGEFEMAEETYRKILKRKKKDPINYLNYGLSLKSSAKYAEAKIQFQEYINLNPSDPMGPVFLQSCDSAQTWLDETIGKEVKNLEQINTELSEFSPVYYVDGKICFSSSRQGSTRALISFDGGRELHRLDLYNIDIEAIDKKELRKGDIVNFKSINTPLHEGSACFSADGKEMYFTKTVKGKRDKETNRSLHTLQVFYTKLDSAGKWTKPVSAFSFNSLKYSVGQPSLSKDGKTIFYMSDKPGGFGKTDIYYSKKMAYGAWSNPINAGKEVNTFGHELFPYIAETGDLYFSSNSHPGMGQLDIFKASYVNGKWTQVRNLKPPFNSIGNDFGISFDGNTPRGFFSSDRFNGKGAEDIYSFSDDIPLQLTFHNDVLQFRDESVYDDIKYKLINDMDQSETPLSLHAGIYSVRLDMNTKYKLNASKNGMPYNSIQLSFSADSTDHNIEIDLKPADRPVMLDGFISLTTRKIGGVETPLLKEIDIISNDADNTEKMYRTFTDKKGYYHISLLIQAGLQYVILSNTVYDSHAGN